MLTIVQRRSGIHVLEHQVRGVPHTYIRMIVGQAGKIVYEVSEHGKLTRQYACPLQHLSVCITCGHSLPALSGEDLKYEQLFEKMHRVWQVVSTFGEKSSC